MSNPSIAIVGCGRWGKNLVRNFSEINVLKYICDQDPKTAHDLATKYNVTALSFDEVLKSDVDAVVVSAPAHQHFELSKKILNAGKSVFVEKPISLNVDEAKQLCALAKQSDKILMVGHLLNYHNAFLKLKELVANGHLGKIQYIYSNRLNLGQFRNEENILWSFAPHDISMILALANSLPEEIYATGCAHLNSHIHDVTTTHLTFPNGIRAHVFVSWLHPYKEQKLVVVGTKGMAVFDDGLPWEEKLKLFPHKINWINGKPHPEKANYENVHLEVEEPLKYECTHFIDCIKNNIRPRTDGEEGLRVLKVLDAAQNSLLKNEPIFLNKKSLLRYFKHESSYIEPSCQIGNDTKIWHFCNIYGDSQIGNNCTIGQNVTIGPNVEIGNNCKIQNNVSLYKGIVLHDEVFCGPSCVFTNVINPRAGIERKDEFKQTVVHKGVTIGANATIICGISLGKYCFIGAGAVVTQDVPAYALVVGNPARQIGWMTRKGERLDLDLKCVLTGKHYIFDDNNNLTLDVTNECAK